MAKEGNPNPTGPKPDKLVRDALKAAMRQDPRHLKEIAGNWVERAKVDQMAANALADRIDGRVPQAIIGDKNEDPIQHEHKVLTPEQSEDLFIAAALKGLIDAKPVNE